MRRALDSSTLSCSRTESTWIFVFWILERKESRQASIFWVSLSSTSASRRFDWSIWSISRAEESLAKDKANKLEAERER